MSNPFLDIYYGLRTIVSDRRSPQSYQPGTLIGSPFDTMGVHRANKYDLVFNLPDAVAAKCRNSMSIDISTLNNVMSTHCTNVIVPQGNISTTGVRTMGEVRNVAYDKIYDTATFTFYMDNNGIIHKAFTLWQSGVFDPVTRQYGYYDDFVSNAIDVRLTNNEQISGGDNFVFKTIRLKEAYPITIAPIQLTGLSGAQPTQFDVTFMCRYCGDVDILGE